MEGNVLFESKPLNKYLQIFVLSYVTLYIFGGILK